MGFDCDYIRNALLTVDKKAQLRVSGPINNASPFTNSVVSATRAILIKFFEKDNF